MKSSGGGVLVAVKSNIHSHEIEHDSNLESISIALPKHDLLINCVYLSPDQPASVYESYSNSIDDLTTKSTFSSLLLVGDFNIPSYDTDIPPIDIQEKVKKGIINGMADLHSLEQFSHVRNFRNVTLDLVFSNQSQVKVDPSEDQIVKPDIHHPPLSFSISVPQEIQAPRYSTCPNLRKCNLEVASTLLSTADLDFIYSDIDLQEKFTKLVSILGEICVSCSPLKRIGTSPFPKWFSKDLINLVIEKKKAHRIYKTTLQPADYYYFCELRNQCKLLSNTCYKNYLTHVDNSIPNNPNSFWSFVRSTRGSSSFPAQVSLDEHTSSDPCEMADMFSTYFSSVFSQPLSSSHSYAFEGNSVLASLWFTPSEVLETLKNLNVSKGAGPDNIPPSFLNHCRTTLAEPLSLLFNSSMQEGIFPDILKVGHVVPILKSGKPSEVKNYRPIAILPSIGKVFETLVLSRLRPFLRPLIHPYQHGFTTARSTVTNLLLFENHVLSAMRQGKQLDVAFVDFAKAFDKVDHSILIAKLEGCGIRGQLLHWLNDYLTGRRLRVKLPFSQSSEFYQTSGVPQGSLLGPYLFITFINDIVDVLQVEALMFADDLKIFVEVSSHEDIARLQTSLDSIHSWCISNNMVLNTSKCSMMTFGRIRAPHLFQYAIDGQPLERVSFVKDLGVIFSDDLTFDHHVNDLCRRANRLLGFLFRSTRGLINPMALRTLYSSLIRQLLEYGSPVWSPYHSGLINSLESIQRKFVRFVGVRQGIQYREVPIEQLQADLHLQDLQVRRNASDVVFLHKLMTGLVDCPSLLAQVDIRVPTGTRSRNIFGRRHYTRGYDYHSPLARMLRLGNTFSTDIDIFHDRSQTIRRKVLAASRPAA